MEPGPQRRLLARRPAAAVPAADHGPGIRLPGGERGGADARPLFAPQLDEAACCRCGAARRPSAAARCASSVPATAACSCTCASTARTRSCAWPTCRARRSRWSSIWPSTKGAVPIELLGRAAFPPIGELPYLLTLPGYAFYWFRLSREAEAPPWHDERAAREDLPVLVLIEGWRSFFPERVAPWRAQSRRQRCARSSRAASCRDFSPPSAGPHPPGSRSRRPPAARGAGLRRSRARRLGVAGVEAIAGWWRSSRSRAAHRPGATSCRSRSRSRTAKRRATASFCPQLLARVRQHAATGVLADAAADEDFCRAVIEAIGAAREFPMQHGTAALRGDRGASRRCAQRMPRELPVTLRRRAGRQYHRRIGRCRSSSRSAGGCIPASTRASRSAATSPRSRISRTACRCSAPSSTTSPTARVLRSRCCRRSSTNQGDGWDYTVNYLVRFLEERVTHVPLADGRARPVPGARAHTRHAHRAAARRAGGRHFRPEPWRPSRSPPPTSSAWRACDAAPRTAALKHAGRAGRPAAAGGGGGRRSSVLARRAALLRSLAGAGRTPRALKIRCHGDYHLRQVLLKRNDFVITDFEGLTRVEASPRSDASARR